MEKSKEFLTRKEVADLFRVTVLTIDTYSKKGYLKPVGIGRRVLFNKEEVYNSLTKL